MYILRCLAKSQYNYTEKGNRQIRIVNRTDKPDQIANLNLQTDPFTNFKILFNSQINHSKLVKIKHIINKHSTDDNSNLNFRINAKLCINSSLEDKPLSTNTFYTKNSRYVWTVH